MMGQQLRTDSLFYYFRLEDQIPDDRLLKRLDRFIDFGFVRERLRDTYSAMGRPSIDPEVLLRLLLVGYLYGITSERRLMEEVRMHLAYRWFSRLGFEREIPDHSTFSKNRHGRFRGAGVFLEVFEPFSANDFGISEIAESMVEMEVRIHSAADGRLGYHPGLVDFEPRAGRLHVALYDQHRASPATTPPLEAHCGPLEGSAMVTQTQGAGSVVRAKPRSSRAAA